ALVPRGGRSAITIASIDTAELLLLRYVTVPCWVVPSVTAVVSRASGLEMSKPPDADPQTLATPPPPHVSEPVHAPHDSVLPQPSEIVPQFLLWAEHVVAMQPTVKLVLGLSYQMPLT